MAGRVNLPAGSAQNIKLNICVKQIGLVILFVLFTAADGKGQSGMRLPDTEGAEEIKHNCIFTCGRETLGQQGIGIFACLL